MSAGVLKQNPNIQTIKKKEANVTGQYKNKIQPQNI